MGELHMLWYLPHDRFYTSHLHVRKSRAGWKTSRLRITVVLQLAQRL